MHHDSSRSVPAASVAATETLKAAAECMQRSGSHQLAVVDETGRQVGTLTDRDVIAQVLRHRGAALAQLVAEVMVPLPRPAPSTSAPANVLSA